MQVIVLHKRQLSETETDIDICICGNKRDLRFLPTFSSVLIFTPPPPSPSPFLFKSPLRSRKETHCTDVAYFE